MGSNGPPNRTKLGFVSTKVELKRRQTYHKIIRKGLGQSFHLGSMLQSILLLLHPQFITRGTELKTELSNCIILVLIGPTIDFRVDTLDHRVSDGLETDVEQLTSNKSSMQR